MVVRLVGEEMTVELTPYQINRINQGVSSTYTNSSLVGVGVGHTTLMELDPSKTGDAFFRNHDIQAVQTDEDAIKTRSKAADLGPSQNIVEGKKGKKKAGLVAPLFGPHLVGPKTRIVLATMRVVIFKQPGATPETPVYIHACYDNDKVVFVTESGKCLYCYRGQLTFE